MKTTFTILITFTLLSCALSQGVDIPLINGRINILVGTPRQNLSVLLETASSNLTLGTLSTTVHCAPPYFPLTNPPLKYNSSKSATSLKTKQQFTLSDDSEIGVVYEDLVSIGGLSFADAQFLVTSSCDESEASDGTLGLAPQSTSGMTPLIQLITAHHNLPQQFSFYLNGDSMTIGGYNPKLAPNGFTYHKIVSPDAWTLNVTDFGLGHTSYFPTGIKGGVNALYSMGADYLVSGSSSVLGALLAKLPSPGYGFSGTGNPCVEDASEVPSFYMIFDGKTRVDIPSSAFYTYFSGGGGIDPAMAAPPSCDVSIQDDWFGEDNSNQIVIGGSIFAQFYTTFNYENKTIGLALLPESVLQTISSQPAGFVGAIGGSIGSIGGVVGGSPIGIIGGLEGISGSIA